MAVLKPSPCQLDLFHDLRVPEDDARTVHYLGQAYDPLLVQETCNGIRAQSSPCSLHVGGWDTGGKHDEDVQGNLSR